MTWNPPLTFVDNTIPTAAQLNVSIRDNLNETAPAKASAAGRYMGTTGVNGIAERVAVEAANLNQCFRLSEVFGNPVLASDGVTSDTGPDVSATASGRFLIGIGARGDAELAFSAVASYEIDFGATGVADDSRALWFSQYLSRQSITDMNTVASGTRNYRMRYRSTNNTSEARFAYRHIMVMPF